MKPLSPMRRRRARGPLPRIAGEDDASALPSVAGDGRWRAASCQGTGDHGRLPGHDPQEVADRSGPLVRTGASDLTASLANGVSKDQAAVIAAVTSPWSNGQTERQITKLKLV